MIDKALEDLLKLDYEQATKIRKDLVKTNRTLEAFEQNGCEWFVHPPFQYLSPSLKKKQYRGGVPADTYLERIDEVLSRTLENSNFSHEDAYFLKAVGCPYLDHVPIKMLIKARS